LLVSVVLRPALTPEQAGCIPLLAGAAMAGAVRDLTGQPVMCKWPNDLLLEERKVGGILAETEVLGGRVAFLILGLGVNLEAPAHVQGAGGIGDAARLRDLLGAFLVRFQAGYAPSAPSWEERVRDAWLPVAATIGRLVEATTTSGATVRGRAVGIDDTGALLISTDDGEARVAFGDVRHLREP
jgi:BirA family biotin operon repressor/biotin-[acetyl-CoA-carboxylase] ligase